jgi:hypothetical protein
MLTVSPAVTARGCRAVQIGSSRNSVRVINFHTSSNADGWRSLRNNGIWLCGRSGDEAAGPGVVYSKNR